MLIVIVGPLVVAAAVAVSAPGGVAGQVVSGAALRAPLMAHDGASVLLVIRHGELRQPVGGTSNYRCRLSRRVTGSCRYKPYRANVQLSLLRLEIGRAHVCTPVTN